MTGTLVLASVVTDVFRYAIGIVLLIIVAYAVVRVASFAHFRTRLEYLRSVLREIHGGRRNGED